jgi:hypothetical protein
MTTNYNVIKFRDKESEEKKRVRVKLKVTTTYGSPKIIGVSPHEQQKLGMQREK